MVVNDLLLPIQADILGTPVVRPVVAETTALGAAYAVGLTVGFWSSRDQLRQLWQEDARWVPSIDADEREARMAKWRKAVTHTLDWHDRSAGLPPDGVGAPRSCGATSCRPS